MLKVTWQFSKVKPPKVILAFVFPSMLVILACFEAFVAGTLFSDKTSLTTFLVPPKTSTCVWVKTIAAGSSRTIVTGLASGSSSNEGS